MRKKFAMLTALVATTGIVAIVAAAAPAEVTIKQAMAKIAGKKGGALPAIKTALKSESPDWKSVQKDTKVVADNSAAIVDSTPKKGEKANYEKLVTVFAANAKALNEAAEKEDLIATNAALGKINGSCMSCHQAHRGK